MIATLTASQRNLLTGMAHRADIAMRDACLLRPGEQGHDAAAIHDALAVIAAQEDLLRLVWNHMHGIDLNGMRRRLDDDGACCANWLKLQDALDARFVGVMP